MAIKKQDSEKERRVEMARCLAQLAGAYGKQFNDAAMEAYFIVLGAMSCAEIRAAFRKAMGEEQFCPPPAVVRKHARAIEEAERPKPKPYTPPTKAEMEEIQRDLERLKRTWARNTRLVHGVRE